MTMINEAYIEPETQILLQFVGEEVLMRTIAALTPAQRKSSLFKQLGEQRYLSALRAGGIENAEMTKRAFTMDPYFAKSKLVMDAAKMGYHLQVGLNHLDVAAQIKSAMGLSEADTQLEEKSTVGGKYEPVR